MSFERCQGPFGELHLRRGRGNSGILRKTRRGRVSKSGYDRKPRRTTIWSQLRPREETRRCEWQHPRLRFDLPRARKELTAVWEQSGCPKPKNPRCLLQNAPSLRKNWSERLSRSCPACPNLEDQDGIWKLLGPEEIGVQLTDGFIRDPEASVSALVFQHPDCTYFPVVGTADN